MTTIQVVKAVDPKSGEAYYSDKHSHAEACKEQGYQVEVVEMSKADYHAIPATAKAATIFSEGQSPRMIEDTRRELATELKRTATTLMVASKLIDDHAGEVWQLVTDHYRTVAASALALAENDAQAIFRTVNAHDALVSVAVGVARLLSNTREFHEGSLGARLAADARAALALAEGNEAVPETVTCDEDCMMCSGEACDMCGAGCWSNRKDCEHDVIDRHRQH